MGKQDAEATVTAGNASGQNDAASMAFVTTPGEGRRAGTDPAREDRLVGGLAGVAPKIMGIGPVPATDKALAKAGITLADVDVIELNEAFAAQRSPSPANGSSPRRTSSAPTSTARESRWVTRSARPVDACWRPSRGNCTAATAATHSKPCASAAAGSGRDLRARGLIRARLTGQAFADRTRSTNA